MKMRVRRLTYEDVELQCPYCESENLVDELDLLGGGDDPYYYVGCLECQLIQYHDFKVPSELDNWIKK